MFAVTDSRNTAPSANLAPVVVGFIVVAIGMAWGTDAGYAINPARDLGPRLAEYFTGYGTAFRDQYGQLYFWVPIVAPLIGGLIGAALYKILIGRFLHRPPRARRSLTRSSLRSTARPAPAPPRSPSAPARRSAPSTVNPYDVHVPESVPSNAQHPYSVARTSQAKRFVLGGKRPRDGGGKQQARDPSGESVRAAQWQTS